jgi:hypothetical protein
MGRKDMYPKDGREKQRSIRIERLLLMMELVQWIWNSGGE